MAKFNDQELRYLQTIAEEGTCGGIPCILCPMSKIKASNGETIRSCLTAVMTLTQDSKISIQDRYKILSNQMILDHLIEKEFVDESTED
jgi:hypothetical protein